MSDATYRRGYGVDLRVRDLTTDEAALVAEQARDWRAQVLRQSLKKTRELLYALPFAIVIVLLAVRRDGTSALYAGAIMTVFLGTLWFVSRRHAFALAASSRGPWHAPEDGWKVREARVVARSIVTAVGDPEQHERWVLFEVPGASWFFVDELCLPPKWAAKTLAHADVRFTRLWPDGVYLDVVATGDAIPVRETSERFVPDDAGADGLVDEPALPAAITALVK